eukprot:scaffold123256_cov32-Tisochrysis_lutea.AAC.1
MAFRAPGRKAPASDLKMETMSATAAQALLSSEQTQVPMPYHPRCPLPQRFRPSPQPTASNCSLQTWGEVRVAILNSTAAIPSDSLALTTYPICQRRALAAANSVGQWRSMHDMTKPAARVVAHVAPPAPPARAQLALPTGSSSSPNLEVVGYSRPDKL